MSIHQVKAAGSRMNNSTNCQLRRLIDALEANGSAGISTIQARELLDVMHPAARVMNLREEGWQIATVWTTSVNAQGYRHRNARYVLVAGPRRKPQSIKAAA